MRGLILIGKASPLRPRQYSSSNGNTTLPPNGSPCSSPFPQRISVTSLRQQPEHHTTPSWLSLPSPPNSRRVIYMALYNLCPTSRPSLLTSGPSLGPSRHPEHASLGPSSSPRPLRFRLPAPSLAQGDAGTFHFMFPSHPGHLPAWPASHPVGYSFHHHVPLLDSEPRGRWGGGRMGQGLGLFFPYCSSDASLATGHIVDAQSTFD